MGLQAHLARGAIRLIYPPTCLTCDARVTQEHALCPECWRDTPFARGLVCDICGVPLPGHDPGHAVHCDDCLRIARPWARGRAALIYDGNARHLILALKHGDRLDLAPAAARWLHRAALPLLEPGMVVAPVPLHWWRLIRRRYNQSALLSGALARLAGLPHIPDLLQRPRGTPSQEGRSREARFANMQGALRVHPRRSAAGRHVLVVDDVMTSGATMAAAAEALLAAGAARVSVLALARVVKLG